MILVEAFPDFFVPNRSSPYLIKIASLIYQYISFLEQVSCNPASVYADRLYLAQVKISVLHICNPHVRQFDQVAFAIGVLCDPRPYLRDVLEC